MNLNTLIKDRNGDDAKDERGNTVSVKAAIILSIDNTLPGDEQLGPVGKLKLFQLATKLTEAGDGDVTLTAPEVTLVLDRCSKVLSILAYGQVVKAIDPAQLD